MISLCYSGPMSETEYIQLTFGKVMRFRRMQMGLTQEYLAEQMNVAQIARPLDRTCRIGA